MPLKYLIAFLIIRMKTKIPLPLLEIIKKKTYVTLGSLNNLDIKEY